MADTGCQSCLASLSIVKKLGFSANNLIPVDLKMHTADDRGIHILGSTILRLSGKDSKGEEKYTKQIVYVTDKTDKLFLSKEACVDLGVISPNFPTLDDAGDTNGVNATATSSHPPPQECRCPKRTNPPPLPKSLPYPATDRRKLQQYLLDYYRSSTFNTCEHQILPLMASPPMRLMIDLHATPTAHHSPIPVPLHW